jgi:hypothetical protein
MKTTTIIIAAVLSLSINTLFAGNFENAVYSEAPSFNLSMAPGTPSVATFEEMKEFTALNFPPVTPNEADFSEVAEESAMDLSAIAPVTPDEADFASDNDTLTLDTFAPVTPAAADFSDGN